MAPVLLILSVYFVIIHGLKSCSEQFEIHEDFCSKVENYNKQENPNFPNATTVHLEIILRDILKVDEENHLVEFVAFSNLVWIDPRIDIKGISARPTKEELNKVYITDVTYANAIHVARRFKYYTASKEEDTGLVKFKLNMF